jgi:hypothetical protein
VPADEHQRVSRIGIGERQSGVGADAYRGRHAWHDLERDALFVQEHGLAGAAVEHEWVAPLQPGNRVALARLLGDEHRDRRLCDVVLGRRSGADALGVRPRPSQRRLGVAVVHDHVRPGEEADAARGNQSRIARAGADDEHASHGRQGTCFGPK